MFLFSLLSIIFFKISGFFLTFKNTMQMSYISYYITNDQNKTRNLFCRYRQNDLVAVRARVEILKKIMRILVENDFCVLRNCQNDWKTSAGLFLITEVYYSKYITLVKTFISAYKCSNLILISMKYTHAHTHVYI